VEFNIFNLIARYFYFNMEDNIYTLPSVLVLPFILETDSNLFVKGIVF